MASLWMLEGIIGRDTNAWLLCRGLALMGRADHPAFARLLETVITSHQQRFLEPRLMRQVFQAATIARALRTPAALPPDLEATAHKW